MRTYVSRFKPIFLLIILIQIVPLSFYFLNVGFTLNGSEILQTSHIDQMLSLVRAFNVFFIALALSMLYLINLVDKNMIKNVMSILRGEYMAMYEEDAQIEFSEKEQVHQKIREIKRLMQKRQYQEALLELNQIDFNLHVKERTNSEHPTLSKFFQNRIYLAHLSKLDFILEVDDDLSDLDYYIENSLLEMLKELYDNAFEAAQQDEFSEVYSKFIREENEFIILINNNGVILPSTHQAHLFDLDYTSKNALIHGQGLYKAKKWIDYFEGSISIRGYDGYTRVMVSLPILKNDIEDPAHRKFSDPKYNGLRLVNKDKED